MREVTNFLIGLGTLLIYPAVGGIIAGIASLFIGRFEWGLFALGPVFLIICLIALAVICWVICGLGKNIRSSVAP